MSQAAAAKSGNHKKSPAIGVKPGTDRQINFKLLDSDSKQGNQCIVLLQNAHDGWQPQRQLRDVGHKQQDNEDGSKIQKQLLEDRFDGYSANPDTNEQRGFNWRSDGTDTEVEDDHDTKENHIHSQLKET